MSGEHKRTSGNGVDAHTGPEDDAHGVKTYIWAHTIKADEHRSEDGHRWLIVDAQGQRAVLLDKIVGTTIPLFVPFYLFFFSMPTPGAYAPWCDLKGKPHWKSCGTRSRKVTADAVTPLFTAQGSLNSSGEPRSTTNAPRV